MLDLRLPYSPVGIVHKLDRNQIFEGQMMNVPSHLHMSIPNTKLVKIKNKYSRKLVLVRKLGVLHKLQI